MLDTPALLCYTFVTLCPTVIPNQGRCDNLVEGRHAEVQQEAPAMKLNLPGDFITRSRGTTLVLLAVGVLALAVASVVGVADNLPGIVLVYVSVAAIVLAVVHRWRSIRRFLLLLVFSLLAFPVTVVLHNLFYALAELASDSVGLAQVLGYLEATFFIVAVLVCPPAALVGAAGAAILGIHQYLRGRHGDA